MPKPRGHFESAKAHLQQHGESRAKDLANALGIAFGTLQAAMKVPTRNGEVIVRREGRAVFYDLPEGDPVPLEDEAKPFNAALWADGELVLWNVGLNEDGRSVTLDSDQTRLLCRLLHGQGPEE